MIVAEKGPTQQQKQNQQTYLNIVRQVPQGYNIVGISRVTPSIFTSHSAEKPLEKLGPATGPDYYQVTLEKQVPPEVLVYAPDPFFGLEVQYPYEAAPAELKKMAVRVDTYSYESRAVTGLGLATGVAVGVGVPVAGAAAVGAVGVGEAVKVGVTRQHLTVEEAVAIGGFAELGTLLAIKAAPAARRGFESLLNKVSPERAMYNRVIVQEMPTVEGLGVPEVKLSLGERLRGLTVPEEATAFKRIQPLKTESFKPSDLMGGGRGSGGDFLVGGGKGGTQQWVQRLLVKQSPVVKAPMKNFLATVEVPKTSVLLTSTLTVEKMIPKTTVAVKTVTQTKQVQQMVQVPKQTELTRTIQTEIKNPFASWKGKPFYQTRQRIREDYEMQFLTMPGELRVPELKPNILETPITMQSQRQIQRQLESTINLQAQTQIPIHFQAPAFMQGQTQRQSLIQQQRQVQQTIQQLMGQTRATPTPRSLWPSGSLGAESLFVSSGRGRKRFGWYEWTFDVEKPGKALRRLISF